MQLKDFIRETLTEIIIGTIESQTILKEQSINAEISPKIGSKWEVAGAVFSDSGKPIHNVEFDVAVSVSEKTGSKGTFGIVISSLGFGAQANKENDNHNISKIKFSIPITLPQ